jgi:HEAT repeat protein
MEDIEELGDRDFLLSFEGVSRLALTDSDARVRELAVRTLWDYESEDLVPVLLNMMENDAILDVRAAAASALGKYIYLGEIEELPATLLHEIEDRLLKVASGNDLSLVRRRSLEAMGFSAHPLVPDLIEQAYRSGNNDWIASALFAMGRSANSRWIPQVMEMLAHDYPAVRMEAARAAGELEVAQATPVLLELLNDEDDDVRSAAIWSLSQLGGEGVREALETMYEETQDDEEAELIESALENLDFTEEIGFFSTLMDIEDGEADEGDLDEEYDLNDLLDDEEEN